jgi:hypothetical protein
MINLESQSHLVKKYHKIVRDGLTEEEWSFFTDLQEF